MLLAQVSVIRCGEESRVQQCGDSHPLPRPLLAGLLPGLPFPFPWRDTLESLWPLPPQHTRSTGGTQEAGGGGFTHLSLFAPNLSVPRKHQQSPKTPTPPPLLELVLLPLAMEQSLEGPDGELGGGEDGEETPGHKGAP